MSNARRSTEVKFEGGLYARIGNPMIIKGNSKDNTLKGTSAADVIYGYEGNDTLHGYAGRDTL